MAREQVGWFGVRLAFISGFPNVITSLSDYKQSGMLHFVRGGGAFLWSENAKFHFCEAPFLSNENLNVIHSIS